MKRHWVKKGQGKIKDELDFKVASTVLSVRDLENLIASVT